MFAQVHVQKAHFVWLNQIYQLCALPGATVPGKFHPALTVLPGTLLRFQEQTRAQCAASASMRSESALSLATSVFKGR